MSGSGFALMKPSPLVTRSLSGWGPKVSNVNEGPGRYCSVVRVPALHQRIVRSIPGQGRVRGLRVPSPPGWVPAGGRRSEVITGVGVLAAVGGFAGEGVGG